MSRIFGRLGGAITRSPDPPRADAENTAYFAYSWISHAWQSALHWMDMLVHMLSHGKGLGECHSARGEQQSTSESECHVTVQLRHGHVTRARHWQVVDQSCVCSLAWSLPLAYDRRTCLDQNMSK